MTSIVDIVGQELMKDILRNWMQWGRENRSLNGLQFPCFELGKGKYICIATMKDGSKLNIIDIMYAPESNLTLKDFAYDCRNTYEQRQQGKFTVLN